MKRSGLKAFAVVVLLVAAIASAAAPSAFAKGNEFDKVCDHLEERYDAKKVKIPFQWLARAAVGIVRPAGVKSFKVTVYRELKFTRESLDSEMRWVMNDAFDSNWTPILRVISRNGEQVYMNAREYKDDVKVLLVTINRDEAVVVRAKFDADKLAEFIENPKIFGIELDGESSS
ncbi:MAG: hypothetical protein J5I65_12130 [Aridibacter famidurans]|nr:hypothetical protein [Aridibacter famidurans]